MVLSISKPEFVEESKGFITAEEQHRPLQEMNTVQINSEIANVEKDRSKNLSAKLLIEFAKRERKEIKSPRMNK